jgi:hypothetical protein
MRRPQTVNTLLQRHSLQFYVLWEFCIAMRHNFLKDLAAQLPANFSTNAPKATQDLQDRIAVLEEENKLLNAKVETLMAVVRK